MSLRDALSRPARRRQLLVLVSALVSLAVGFWLGAGHERLMSNERARLKTELTEARNALAQQEAELAAVRLDWTVEQEAAEALRGEIRELQDQVAGLEEEINFYQGMMAPEERQRGLTVRSLTVTPTPDPEVFAYTLVLQQLAGKHAWINGHASLEVEGFEDGHPARRVWTDLSADHAPPGTRFRFRYFQRIEGRLTLPDGFKPTTITVTARERGTHGQSVQRRFDWAVSEDDTDV